MPCQHYKDALIEAAASGAAPQGELRAHLALCTDCLSTLEQERALFASIDGGLHVTANAEMPASLWPRVRARLEEESAPHRVWGTNWLALASAAVMVVAFFAVRIVLRTNVVQRPVETTGKIGSTPRVTPSPRNQGHVFAPAMEKERPQQRQVTITKNSAAPEVLARGKGMPEVLVPGDQEVLLTEYAEQWRLHKRAPLIAQGFDATILVPLLVAPIQIGELDVKLLADDRSQ